MMGLRVMALDFGEASALAYLEAHSRRPECRKH